MKRSCGYEAIIVIIDTVNVFIFMNTGINALPSPIFRVTLLSSSTFMAEGAGEGREAAVAGEAAVILHTAAVILTQAAVAAAVSGTSSRHSGRDLRPLLQIQSLPVQLQRANAAQEALLSGRRSSWRGKHSLLWKHTAVQTRREAQMTLNDSKDGFYHADSVTFSHAVKGLNCGGWFCSANPSRLFKTNDRWAFFLLWWAESVSLSHSFVLYMVTALGRILCFFDKLQNTEIMLSAYFSVQRFSANSFEWTPRCASCVI